MLKIWRKLATPAKRGAFILGSLAAMVAVALLIARKPWECNVPASRGMRIADYVGIYSWWAGAANFLLMVALAASARWWMRPSRGGLFRLPRPSFPGWFWPLTVLAMLLCAWFGAHRLRHSFWDDEVYAMRRAIHGQWKRNDDGSIRFRPVSWQETFWFFEKPQHQLHSIVTRVVLDVWRAVAKPEGLKFRRGRRTHSELSRRRPLGWRARAVALAFGFSCRRSDCRVSSCRSSLAHSLCERAARLFLHAVHPPALLRVSH